MWRQAKEEIEMLKEFWSNKFPSTDKIIQYLFGRKSKLFHLLNEELDVTYAECCRFLATFFTAAQVNLPPLRLYANSCIDTTGLMEEDEYMKIIKKINNMNTDDPNLDDDALWMRLEDCFNSVAKRTFLSKQGV